MTLAERTAGLPRPRLLLLSGVSPLRSAGPLAAQIAPAGGTPAPWDTEGAAPSPLAWEQVLDFAPETLVLALPDGGADAGYAAAAALAAHPGWFDLPCVRAADCYAVDCTALAADPVVLATILHPEEFTDLLPPYSVRLFPGETLQRAAEEPGE